MLHLHRAERADLLVDALGEVLCTPLADPFTAEVVAVPAKGVERWVSQRLSAVLGTERGDGVSANLLFPSPARLVAQVVAAAGGTEADDDPWAPGRVLWRLLDVIDSCTGEPWCGVLVAHLGAGDPDSHRRGRRWATAALLADLFASYGAERPAMLVDWAAERDTDGADAALPDDLRWQPALWRRLRSELGAPCPAERLEPTCRRVQDEPDVVDLPERLSLFGPTRLTTEQLTVLQALAVRRDVHLWVPHPSSAMWERLRAVPAGGKRRDDASGLHVTHPLLASLARDTRELQQRLQPLVGADTHHPGAGTPTTLLAHLQRAVRDDVEPVRVATADGSVQVHACHGPARQVEVLREALLHAFEADPSLEPRDVLVMCPDVETWAPLVKAAFGQGAAAGPDAHPGHRLRVRLADRSLRQTNPLLDTVSALLHLADGRVTASELLDLAATAPVRRRFGFSDDDLEQLRTWAVRAGVRWGIGQQQRAAFDLVELEQGTWRAGLDRVLVGVTADESDLAWIDRVLPLDDVDSTDVDLAGRLAELVDRLWSVLARLQGPQPAVVWSAELSRALDLLTDVADRDAWQLVQARRELGAATEHAGDVELRLADVRAMLAGRLAGRPTRANFRTGELTVCTMVPMRSVPHRVVALLGLDDDVFPRGAGVDGDDVLARDPCVGERDRRSEDRQLLLDALMSATEHLVITYAGADEVSGRTRPPAVPLGELLDALDLTAVGARESVVTRHPLQAFDARNFRPGDLGAPGAFSFDPAARDAARRARQPEADVPTIADLTLTPLAPTDVDLAELSAFLRHPVREFCRRRLDLEVFERDDEVLDTMPVDLDGLQNWGVGDRMLRDRLRGIGAAEALNMEWRRGILPPGRLGWRRAQAVSAVVEKIAADALAARAGLPGDSRDVDIDLGAGRRLRGTVADLFGERVVAVSYSSVGARQHVEAWLSLLALTATDPQVAWSTGAVGRRAEGSDRLVLTGVDEAAARSTLMDLVALYDLGMQQPLRLPLKAGFAARRSLDFAAREWSGRFPEREDRVHAMVWGTEAPFSVLTDGAPETALPALAARLWQPIMARVAH